LIGKNHNIVRDEDMPKAIFKFLWERLNRGEDSYCLLRIGLKMGDTTGILPIYPSFIGGKPVKVSINFTNIYKGGEIRGAK